jgi:hypothetical protein
MALGAATNQGVTATNVVQYMTPFAAVAGVAVVTLSFISRAE